MNLTRASFQALFVALALSAVACGGGDDDEAPQESSDLEGMYQLTSFTLTQPCDAAPVDQPLDTPYFEIVYYVGELGLVGYKCSSPDKTSCDTTGFTLFLAAKPIGGDAYREQQALTTGNLVDGCGVDYYGTDIQKSSVGVTISYLRTRGSTTGQACGGEDIPDATLTQFRAFDCSSIALREGTRL